VFDQARPVLAVGYGASGMVMIDQVSQLMAALPFDPAMRLAWFQIANAVAARLLLLGVASLVVLIVGVRLHHRRALWASSLLGAAVAALAMLVAWSVLWDGATVLSAFGPPGGNLAAFQGQRLRSLIGAGVALLVVAAAVPAGVLAWRSFGDIAPGQLSTTRNRLPG